MIFNKNHHQKGVAILASIFIILLLAWLATQITFETTSEYLIYARSPQKLQAYYNARSGIELSRLRLTIYKIAKKQFAQQLGSQSALLNKIWNLPFMWPPVIDEKTLSDDKSSIEEAIKSSSIPGSFVTTIQDEGSRIDINDLASPSQKNSEITKKRIIQLLETALLQDRDFINKMNHQTPEQIVSRLQDWIDHDTQGILESSEPQEAYNRWLRSPEELFDVQSIPFEIRWFLFKYITVFGQKSINPNTASKDLLMSLDISITDKIATEIINRRENIRLGGPFTSKEDFWNFIAYHGAKIDPEKQAIIPLVFDDILSFRIQSIGEYKNNVHTIEAVVWDFDQIVDLISKEVTNELKVTSSSAQDQSKVGGSTQNKDNLLLPIVYWLEK